MRLHARPTRRWTCLALALTLTTGGFFSPRGVGARIDRKPVIITFGQPNIWSLEQAHYLLTRMHERSLDLASRPPTGNDLDPNATNGARLNTLKTLLEGGVSFDQGLGSQNQLVTQSSQHTFARRQELEARKDQRQAELQRVSGELAGLNFERERMNGSGATEAEKKLKDVEIKSKTAEQAALTSEIGNLDTEIGKNPAPTGTPSAVSVPTPFDKARLGDSVVDKMLADGGLKNELRKDVRLAATTILDNHIQMQYEIIAKQLTLLRDEVGPNERLVFLELPQSIYTTPGKSEEMLAQVWWQVAHLDYTPDARRDDLVSLRLRHRHYQEETAGLIEQLSNQSKEKAQLESDLEKRQAAGASPDIDRQKRVAILTADIVNTQQRLKQAQETIDDLVEEQADAVARRQQVKGDEEALPTTEEGLLKMIRTVDLIPRQSSLNVNDIQDTIRAGAFTAAFSFLFGFGGKVSYQRQRELYEQYIHQDIFASSFGKGTRDFGWTFGPLPGSKRLAPGIRTTYAVMVIPRNVTKLKFATAGCYFPRKRNAPMNFLDTGNGDWTQPGKVDEYRCEQSTPAPYEVSVPGSRGNGFYATGVAYHPAEPGQRIAVSVAGKDFSTQTGVLIDGVPLCPSAGVAQPVLAPRKCSAPSDNDDEISGEFERLNPRQLMLTFRMPKDYKGIPTITIVTPGRAIDLNDLWLDVNGVINQKLKDSDFMFGKRPQKKLALTGLDIFRSDPKSQTVFAVLSGIDLPKHFDPAKVDLRINGRAAELSNPAGGAHQPVKVLQAGSEFYRLEFDLPSSDTIDVSIVRDDDYATKSFPNPLRLLIGEVSVVASEPKGRGSVLTLRVKGVGFGDNPQITVQGVTNPHVIPINSGEAAVELTNPPALIVLTVTNQHTHASAHALVTRPPAKKEE